MTTGQRIATQHKLYRNLQCSPRKCIVFSVDETVGSFVVICLEL